MLYRAVLPKLTRLNTPVSDIRRRAFDATSQIIRLLQTLSASRTSVLWWPVPHANLSIAGSYMIHMFASARDGEDGTQWHAQLDTFRQLLETQGAGFAVIRFASVRLDILAGNTTSSYIDASERS
ncbi:hypothetical protein LTR47_002319 [Exophiala xenobiotica]|nr:hypothetical protein LTR41_005082 [Exophiala xenobiotica]KAK5236368.1 hypothetical protein LTR47_002319 [Exophiala xenobiotica]KAK5258682.1 hypothetical protein LTR40_007419 [Exophiala xenobiotica]KAK5323143.1 hypothetical protein LTR93_005196 [Exophiala xenobiotica]KAK5350479.1 hypothetical protein LTR61_005676 [Exophiala xenobiotica]